MDNPPSSELLSPLRFQPPTQKDVFSYFKKPSTKTNLENLKRFDHSLDIIHKNQYIRSTEEEEFLASIIKDFNFFDINNNTKADKDMIRLSRVFKYEHFPAGTPIVHKDDIGDKLYLILKGQAIAYIEIFQDHLQNAMETSPKAPSHEFTSEPSSPMIPQSPGKIPQSPGKSPTFKGGFTDEVNMYNKSEKPVVLFKPKLTKKQTLQFQTQFAFKAAREFSRDHPPEAIWDVNKAINLSFAGKSRQELEEDSSPGVQDVDDDYLDMLFEYKLLEEISETMPGKYIKDGYFKYKPVKRMGAGDYFGELALIINKPRSATVVACRDVHCLSLTKKDYQDVTMRSLESINPNIRFLKEFFPEATKINLAKIAYSLTEHHLNYNNKIYEEGDFPDSMYFIKQGEVQLIKSMNTDTFELASPMAGRKKRCTITTIGKGEVLGEDEILFEREREYTAIVASRDVVVMKLSKKTYDTFTESYKMLFNNMKMMCKMKNQFRDQQRSQAQKLAESFNASHLNMINEEQQSQCRALGKPYTRLSVRVYHDPPELLCVSPRRRQKETSPSAAADQSQQNLREGSKEKLSLRDYNTGISKDFLKIKYYNEVPTPSTAAVSNSTTTSRRKLQLKRRPKEGIQQESPSTTTQEKELSTPKNITIDNETKSRLKKYLTDQVPQSLSKSKISTFYTNNTSVERVDFTLTPKAINNNNISPIKGEADDYSLSRIHGSTTHRPSTCRKPPVIKALRMNNLSIGMDYSVRKADRALTGRTDFSVSSFDDEAFDGRMKAIDELFSNQPHSPRRGARPPTTGGYYCAKKFTPGRLGEHSISKSNSPRNALSLTTKLSELQRSKELPRENNKSLDQTKFAAGLLSARQRIGIKMGSDGIVKIHNIKPVINQPVESEKFENIHVRRTFTEYFESTGSKIPGQRKMLVSSSHNMFRKKTSKGHLKERFPLNKEGSKAIQTGSQTEDSLRVSKVINK